MGVARQKARVRASKKWSGRTLRVPIKYQKNTTGTSFRGFDTFSVSATDNRVNMEFTRYYAGISKERSKEIHQKIIGCT